MTSTQSESHYESGEAVRPLPGALLIFSGHTPQLRTVVLPEKGTVVLGRNDVGGVPLSDQRVSSRHCELGFDGQRFTVTDLGSNNGTWVDGVKIERSAPALAGGVLRLAHSVFLLCADLRPFLAGTVEQGKRVIGPAYRAVLDRIAVAGRGGFSVLITGDNGTGKEWAAHVFHEAAERPGPFVAVNCAAVPPTLAESQFFGAVKGSHSTATADSTGFVQAADGGVLFLDELGELDPKVQASLLRVVQEKQVTVVGTTVSKPVKLRFCSATNKDLGVAIKDGAFRQDLYYRLAERIERLPSLAERREEIPWLLVHALGEQPVHATLVERALLRPWPGNVRELLSQAKQAAETAKGGPVRGEHLAPTAGMPTGSSPAHKPRSLVETLPAGPGAPPVVGKEDVERALADNKGNIAAAARALNLHRTQLYRLMKKHGLDDGQAQPPDAE